MESVVLNYTMSMYLVYIEFVIVDRAIKGLQQIHLISL